MSSVHRLIQYCTNTKDFMVPSMWGSVSRISLSMTILNCVLRVLVMVKPCIRETGLISFAQPPGRQARRSLRTSTIKRMLHNHVEHMTLGLFGVPTVCLGFSSIPSFFAPSFTHSILHCNDDEPAPNLLPNNKPSRHELPRAGKGKHKI